MEPVINFITEWWGIIVSVVGIPCIAIYLCLGFFFALFSTDDPSTPPFLPYFIIFFWPLFLLGLLIKDAAWWLYRKLAWIFFGIYYEMEYTGPRCGQYTIHHKCDAVYINGEYGLTVRWKQKIEEEYSPAHVAAEKAEYDDDYDFDGFWETPIGRFWTDLPKFAAGELTEEYMMANYQDVCVNLKDVLKYNWNFKY